MKTHDFSGILLAGGRSTRMGRDKAELSIAGKTLIEWQVEKLQNLGVGEILLSGAGHTHPAARTVPDIYPGRGPLGGLHACLMVAKAIHCIVLSVDAPLVPSEVLNALMGHHLTSGAEITILCHGDYLEPLIGIYDRGVVDRIETLIKNDALSVKALLHIAHTEIFTAEDDPVAFTNCNTPETFETIQQIIAE